MNAPLVSRGPLGLLAAVLAGGVSMALLVTALLHANSVIICLAYFVAFPLYVAGLGAGALAGILAPVTGTVALFATQPPNIAVIYAIGYAIPTMGITYLALRYRVAADQKIYWFPEGKLLTAITLYPCVMFLIAAAVATTHPGGLLDMTQHAFSQVADQLAKKFNPDQLAVFKQALDNAAKIAPALISFTWIFVTIVTIGAAQSLVKQQKWNIRDSFVLTALHVPSALIYSVAATGLLGVFAPEPYDYIGKNLSLILGLPFFFVGLAVMHAFFNSLEPAVKFICYAVFYIALVLIPWVLLPVAAIGVVDQWADFRKRIAHKTK